MLNNIVQLVGINNENNIITNKNGTSFFKNNQLKYSRYGLEFRKISSNQQAEYNEIIKFIKQIVLLTKNSIWDLCLAE